MWYFKMIDKTQTAITVEGFCQDDVECFIRGEERLNRGPAQVLVANLNPEVYIVEDVHHMKIDVQEAFLPEECHGFVHYG